MSGGFEVMFFIVFLFVIGVIMTSVIKGIGTWTKNNNSPRLMVKASIVSKRINTKHRNHAVGGDMSGSQGYHRTTSSTYYITFEVESGDRMEFHISGEEYGLLVEGDYGELSFQGTRYLGFVRER
ncbi:DUF2500 domain-containing protein [uncultured Clostridium sp.]|jgi:hypothetical protein|uniref:DUF2500 domain-containing protein n=1 Tax=uncultured Clostridium sp. TaxID=59620 RepID=UPI00260C1100|nr:DUF2500 domain-containing protein [uncultured Clostridium sp.]